MSRLDALGRAACSRSPWSAGPHAHSIPDNPNVGYAGGDAGSKCKRHGRLGRLHQMYGQVGRGSPADQESGFFSELCRRANLRRQSDALLYERVMWETAHRVVAWGRAPPTRERTAPVPSAPQPQGSGPLSFAHATELRRCVARTAAHPQHHALNRPTAARGACGRDGRRLAGAGGWADAPTLVTSLLCALIEEAGKGGPDLKVEE
jgi:hypothetical protein